MIHPRELPWVLSRKSAVLGSSGLFWAGLTSWGLASEVSNPECHRRMRASFVLWARPTFFASNCKFVCPDHNFLEAWCDHNPVSNHFSIQQPLIRPLYNSRQAQESLLVWAGSASRTNSESEVFYDFIQNYWLENRIGDQASYFDFSEFWKAVFAGFGHMLGHFRKFLIFWIFESGFRWFWTYNKVTHFCKKLSSRHNICCPTPTCKTKVTKTKMLLTFTSDD